MTVVHKNLTLDAPMLPFHTNVYMLEMPTRRLAQETDTNTQAVQGYTGIATSALNTLI